MVLFSHYPRPVFPISSDLNFLIFSSKCISPNIWSSWFSHGLATVHDSFAPTILSIRFQVGRRLVFMTSLDYVDFGWRASRTAWFKTKTKCHYTYKKIKFKLVSELSRHPVHYIFVRRAKYNIKTVVFYFSRKRNVISV